MGCAINWSAARNVAAMGWNAASDRSCCRIRILWQVLKAAVPLFVLTWTYSGYLSLSTIPASKPRDMACLPISCVPCADERLSCASAIWNGPLRNGERWRDSIRVADIKQHPFGKLPSHLSCFQIDDEQSLAAFHFARIRALLPDTREDRPLLVSEIYREPHQFLGAWDFLDALDGPHADVQRVQRLDGNNRFNGCGSKCIHGSPPVIRRVGWKRDSRIALFIANRRTRDNAQRNDSRPDGKSVIRSVILRRAGAHLCGSFRQRKPEDACCLQFFFIGLTRVAPAPRQNFLRERAQRFEFFLRGIHESCFAQSYDGTVIHGVIEDRASENDAVHERNRHANFRPLAEAAEHPACSRAMKIDCLADAPVQSGNHVRLAAQ